jgi:hypothetical protein
MSSTNISSLVNNLKNNQQITKNASDTIGNFASKFDLAVVVDIILDSYHPYFGINSNNSNSVMSARIGSKNQQIPINYKNEIPNSGDLDVSYIGRAKIRLLDKDKQTNPDKLPWAIPLNNTITQYPLINEQVLVTKIGENYYYTSVLNKNNYVGVNGDFVTEKSYGLTGESAVPYENPEKRKSYVSHPIFVPQAGIGYFGNYFILNPYIRSLKKHEGDTIIESRFGQSISFSSYDDVRENDKGSGEYSSYVLPGNILKESKNGGFGNPKITIRNRQRQLAQDKEISGVHRKLPKIQPIQNSEKNYGGQIDSDINNDGSTIELSSGVTISKWKSTVYKSIFGISQDNNPTEEQVNFNPAGSTNFKFPILDKDQIVINTDRLILSSRLSETLHFSKKRYSVVTDNEYTVDANDQIVLTTNNLTCINSPQIFLGQYGETNEPALLGQTTVDWLYDLCNWLLDHVHWYHHVHPHPHGHVDAGQINIENTKDASPDQTQIPVQQIKLKLLRDTLHKTLSRRVFVTGGGYAPGSNGVKPPGSGGECKDPVEINTVTGAGVVGDFKGRNRREGPVQIEFEFED